jgi:hypothetical protein
MKPRPLDLQRLRVHPLAERKTLLRADDILLDPDSPAPLISDIAQSAIREAATRIKAARERGASVILMYGAHLIRNGAARIVSEMMQRGWVTHLATNGAGTIHDWEFSWLGASCEKVEENVAAGTFGTWDETGRAIHLALRAGLARGEGWGAALGRFIHDDAEGFTHRWKHASMLAEAFRLDVPATVHPGIGYDIIACHPMFDGALLGQAAALDFAQVAGAVDALDGGVVLVIGSAIMAPQVFEKSLSCVHNLRFQDGRPPVSGHTIYVVDLQDGGGWDWTQGEPPKTSPAYYLRFCKSFSRMGGEMRYVQSDNAAFAHNLLRALR